MVAAYLVDTNVLIDYLADALPAEYTYLVNELIDNDELYISVITQIELLCFEAPEAYNQSCQNLISLAHTVPLQDPAIIDKAISIRKTARIKLPDAVVAATAITLNRSLLSRNERDFKRVDELQYRNPYH
ncbi:type II toxin-antitoxin system VapC family toxin [Spirosoma rhododendri]|uniref:Type II toxin-antitoxin system VapC family toxin n=1 Tax=Spirosoma rhododendri TaxID=2728024 RepID=A0A7L5DXJ6_9BACT|nr:type II toxin-antitoxin system VapC family toxin [Spirosoma rhododendri]QJD80250.1 type II toxin-antitoxin system VapC family toxin [Spirosoma rhododendri]